MHLFILFLNKVLNIGKPNGLLIDADVLKEISEITPSGLIDVCEHSVLELGIVLELGVGANFSVHLVSEDMLISQEVFHFGLIDWHSFLFGELHGVLLMLVSVFQGKVLIFTNFGQLFSLLVRASSVDQVVGVLFVGIKVSVFVLNQMEEDFCLLLVKVGEDWHQLLEVLLVFLVTFELCFGCKVHFLNIKLEFIRVSIHILQNLFGDEFLIIEFSDFLFWIELDTFIMIEIFSVHLEEEVPLLLALFGLWEFLSLDHVEWEG
jgi:hypothetical protein